MRGAVDQALACGDLDRAAALAQQAIDGGARHAMLFGLAGLGRQNAGDFAAAAGLLNQAVALAPDDPGILAMAGEALRHAGRPDEAVAMFDRALRRDPRSLAAWYGRGQACESAGAIGPAADSYRRITELDPHSAPGFAGLASMQMQLGDRSAARQLARHAEGLDPRDLTTAIVLSRCDCAEGAFAAAAARLRGLAARSDLGANDRVLVLGLLGDALDGLEATRDAYDAYSAANARFAEQHAAPATSHRAIVEAVDAAVARHAPARFAGPAPAVAGEAAGHVFLIGYPRSGTTLIEQVLATDPEVATFEEAPTLREAEQAFLSQQGIARLTSLGGDEAAGFRRAYWANVAAAGGDVTGRTFIDMDPFKGTDLPIIARLFPKARIILMRRDPRDVVWSCFRRTFVFNAATAEFTSLQRAAAHYDAMMRLIERCVATLSLNVHVIDYADLVHDFDRVTAAACDFAGVVWTPAVRDFSATARRRGVRTASADQVRRPLFDGNGQWRRYAPQMAAVLPLLEPWADRFGYAA